MQVARDALMQSQEDISFLKEEIERIKAGAAARDVEKLQNGLSKHSDLSELQRELEQATVAAEINKAKADLYDEVAKHAQDLEARVKQLSSSQAEKLDSQRQVDSLSSSLKVRVCGKCTCRCNNH